jgi:predicted site-specific integrase-resolvase
VNLKGWAASQGVSYATARSWRRAGLLPVPARKVGGLVLVGDPAAPAAPPGQTVVYASVSSADQRPDLDRQVARVTEWATGRGLPVDRVVTEVGSTLNGRRREFLALLRDPPETVITVEHCGRFARFGAEYVEAALAVQGRSLLVADQSGVDDDVVGDVTEILTSPPERRAAAGRAVRAVAALGREGPG